METREVLVDMDPQGSAYGTMIRRLRGSTIGQRELAQRAGSTEAYIADVEDGIVQPTIHQADQLLRCLGYHVAIDITRLTDDTRPSVQLSMSAEERMQLGAELHNASVELRDAVDLSADIETDDWFPASRVREHRRPMSRRPAAI